MRLQIDELGKVAITIEQGYWNNSKDYDKLTVVEKEGTFGTFISRKPVPAGTPLTNRTYWIPFSSLKEEIVLAYEEWVNRYGGIVSNEAIVINQLQKIINDIYSHIPQGIFVEGDIDCIEHGTSGVLKLHVGTTNEKEAKFFVYVNDVLFGTYNIVEETIDIPVNGDTAVRVECVQNEFSYIGNWNVIDVYPTYIGCSNEYNNILNNDSYKIPVTTNIDGEYTLNVETEGDFIFICVPKSTIVDKVTMNGFDVHMKDEVMVTDEHNIEYKIFKSPNGYNIGEYEIFIGEYKGDDKDTIEIILERIDTLYSKFDNITKADEEDITEVSENDTKVFKLADKEYNAKSFSGLGRVNLRKNIVDGHNYLTQEMVSKANTIYKIQYDYEIAPVTTGYIAELNQGTIEVEGHTFNYKVIAANAGDIITKESGMGNTTVILYMTSDNVWHNPHTLVLTVENGWTIAIADVVGGSTAVNYNITRKEITIPENCVLEFDGGSLSGGTLVGNGTGIQAGIVKIFDTDVILTGNWNVAEAYPEWFGAVSTEDYNYNYAEINTQAIRKTVDSFINICFSAPLPNIYAVQELNNNDTCVIPIINKRNIYGQVCYEEGTQIKYVGQRNIPIFYIYNGRSSRGTEISNIFLKGNNGTTSQDNKVGIGIKVENSSTAIILKNIRCRNFDTGIISNTWSVLYLACGCTVCKNGFVITEESASQPTGASTTNTMIKCGADTCDIGFSINKLIYTTFLNCSCDASRIAYKIYNCSCLSFINCGCEACLQAIAIGDKEKSPNNSANCISFQNCTFVFNNNRFTPTVEDLNNYVNLYEAFNIKIELCHFIFDYLPQGLDADYSYFIKVKKSVRAITNLYISKISKDGLSFPFSIAQDNFIHNMIAVSENGTTYGRFFTAGAIELEFQVPRGSDSFLPHFYNNHCMFQGKTFFSISSDKLLIWNEHGGWNQGRWEEMDGTTPGVQRTGLITKRPATSDIPAGFTYVVTTSFDVGGTTYNAGVYAYIGSDNWITPDGTTVSDGTLPTRS